MPRRGSITSPADARAAARRGATRTVAVAGAAPAKCSRPSAPPVARRRAFPSSLVATARSTAATVSSLSLAPVQAVAEGRTVAAVVAAAGSTQSAGARGDAYFLGQLPPRLHRPLQHQALGTRRPVRTRRRSKRPAGAAPAPSPGRCSSGVARLATKSRERTVHVRRYRR